MKMDVYYLLSDRRSRRFMFYLVLLEAMYLRIGVGYVERGRFLIIFFIVVVSVKHTNILTCHSAILKVCTSLPPAGWHCLRS